MRMTIAGETYRYVIADLNGGAVYQYMCIRKVDDDIVFITATSTNEADITDVLSSLEAAH